MRRLPIGLVLLTCTLALLAGCGPRPQAALPTVAPAPTVAPLPTTAPAPTAAPVATITAAALGANLDAYFAERLEQGTFSGMVLVARGDEVVLRKGYGYADVAAQIPNGPETAYRIGNVTRTVTAAAIMLLESQGKLSVEDSICAYLDDCPPAWEPITLHHLLSETSGLPEYMLQPAFKQIGAVPLTPDELIGFVRDQPLFSTPGETWSFTHTNYVLLGMVIERVSGQPYEQFLQEQIFAPLGMTATGLSGQPANLATGYLVYRLGRTPSATIDPSVGYAAFGLYSTIDDMQRWAEAVTGDTLLPAAQREAMHKQHADADGWGYGYGILLNDRYWGDHKLDVRGVPWLSYPGFYASNWDITDEEFTIMILSNQALATCPNDSVAGILLAQP